MHLPTPEGTKVSSRADEGAVEVARHVSRPPDRPIIRDQPGLASASTSPLFFDWHVGWLFGLAREAL